MTQTKSNLPSNQHISNRLEALFGRARGTVWVTRERPKIDRIACPWLVLRFLDPAAEFIYVPKNQVFAEAKRRNAVAYDIPGAPFEHDEGRCTFDTFITHFGLADPALLGVAPIVRGADTGDMTLAPQSAGLVAVSLGLSRLFANDHEMLRHGLVLYDALYAWSREARDEHHSWSPDAKPR